MEAINFISIITIAFLGSFGHCIGMCGGVVVAYTSTKIDKTWIVSKQVIAHLFYSLGRVSTYATLGAIFGYLGSVVSFTGTTRGFLLVFAGVVMVFVGFSLFGSLKFLTSIEYSFIKTNWYQNLFKKLIKSRSLSSFFYLGMLNGLLPCGFVYVFAVSAAGSSSAFYGALIMIVFGISTIPALFIMGFFVGIVQKGNLRYIFMRVAAVAVILYGFFTIYNGYNFIIDPVRSMLDCH